MKILNETLAAMLTEMRIYTSFLRVLDERLSCKGFGEWATDEEYEVLRPIIKARWEAINHEARQPTKK